VNLRMTRADQFAEPTDSIPVLILADDVLVRAGLAALLATLDGLRVAGQQALSPPGEAQQALSPPGEASTVAGAAPSTHAVPAPAFQPAHALVLADLGWDGAQVEVLAELVERSERVLALAATEAAARAAWRAGARGVLSRDASPVQLAAAIRAVADGLLVAAEDFAAGLVRGAAAPSAAQDPSERAMAQAALGEPLTHRELEVLQLLVGGRSNKQVAHALGISEHTIKDHVDAILGKLNAASRTAAVVRAIQTGLVTV
jgi:DNA-binding NarL/FixJ family response regulator